MQQNKHIALTLSALVCAVTLVITLGISQTQARYDNTISWEGIYLSEKPVLESNFLAEGGQLVLLSDWNISTSSYRMLDIQLKTDSGTQTGNLACQVDSDLLTATVDQDRFTLGTIANHAMLTLARTDKAISLQEKTTVTVRVSWTPEGESSSTAWADFTVELFPGATDIVSYSTPRTYENITIACPETFSREELLALKLTLPKDAETLILSCDGMQFPANTRYFLLGEDARVLGDADMISIPTEGREEMTVLLDLSWAEDAMYRNSFLICASAYADGAEFAIANVNVSASLHAMQVEADKKGYLLKADARAQVLVGGDLEGFTYTLQQLKNTDGVIAYTDCQHLNITTETINNGENTQRKVVISNHNSAAPAGTYRLLLQRTYDGIVVTSFEIPIFVCY